MKNAFRILICICIIAFCAPVKGELNSEIDNIINSSDLSITSAVSISIRDVKTGNIVYERDSDLLLHPASTLKAFTTAVDLDVLGKDSKITTALYKNKDDIYIKLTADPLFSENDLVNLFKKANLREIKGFVYLDDSIIDDINWGIGWMWDDETNIHMPKYSPYNINRNLGRITIIPTLDGDLPKVNASFPVKIVNKAMTSDKNSINITTKPWELPNTIFISGKVRSKIVKTVPVTCPKELFIYKLKKVLSSLNIKLTGNIKQGKVKAGSQRVSEVSRNVLDIIKHTNKNSDNLAAETMFKLAGAKFTGLRGSTKSGFKAFNSFYNKLGVDTSNIMLVDASGVSHNDLVSTDWMSNTLKKLHDVENSAVFLSTLAEPCGIGTLRNRPKPLKGRLWAKTGTIAGVSGIVGYIKADSGSLYSFAILTQNYKGSSSRAKALEDAILLRFSKF